jgi:hypothetical protein
VIGKGPIAVSATGISGAEKGGEPSHSSARAGVAERQMASARAKPLEEPILMNLLILKS